MIATAHTVAQSGRPLWGFFAILAVFAVMLVGMALAANRMAQS